MKAESVIAEGTDLKGLSWTILAQRHGAELTSMIRVRAADGRMLHGGGAGGPPPQAGRLMNVSTGGSDTNPYCQLARIHPAVRRVDLVTATGDALHVPVYDSPGFPDVRLVALLIHRDRWLDYVAGFSETGHELERFDLAFHQEFWHRGQNRHQQPQ